MVEDLVFNKFYFILVILILVGLVVKDLVVWFYGNIWVFCRFRFSVFSLFWEFYISFSFFFSGFALEGENFIRFIIFGFLFGVWGGR